MEAESPQPTKRQMRNDDHVSVTLKNYRYIVNSELHEIQIGIGRIREACGFECIPIYLLISYVLYRY